jgi:hypothetical protein
MAHYRITQIEDYEQFIGSESVERIREKARRLGVLRVANFNSTYYDGGVAEKISSLTLLMNSLGLRTEWRVIQGTADFFSITKKMHNALQGGDIDLSKIKREIFEQVIYENSVRNFLDHDFIIVHDPQPLALIEHYEKKCPVALALSPRPFQTERRDLEISTALDRQVRCGHRQLSRIQTGNQTAGARFHAGDRSVHDQELSPQREGDR